MSAYGAHVRLEALSVNRPAGDHLLYLPSGRLLAIWTLGHRETLADLLYLWSIQFYGHYKGGVRYDYLTQIYERVITDLDPRFRDAYLLGSLILSVEAGDSEAALRLLDKGIRENPDDWLLPFEAGFVAYDRLRDYSRAAGYFETAMSRPGAHPVVRRFHAEMFNRMGDKRRSLDLWTEILRTVDSDYTREVARKHVHDLTLEYHVDLLAAAVERYRERAGSLPPDLRELVAAGLLNRIPVDPEGQTYLYDPHTGEVSPRAQRLLPSRSRDLRR